MSCDSDFRAGPTLDQAVPVDLDKCRFFERRDGTFTVFYDDDSGVILVGSVISISDEDWPDAPSDKSGAPPAQLPPPTSAPPLNPPFQPLAPQHNDAGSGPQPEHDLTRLLADPRVEAMTKARINRPELAALIDGLEDAHNLAHALACGQADPGDDAVLAHVLEGLVTDARALAAKLDA